MFRKTEGERMKEKVRERDTGRSERIMEMMREKVRERERERRMGERKREGLIERMRGMADGRSKRQKRRERDVIERMGLVTLNPIQLTIFRLLFSSRVLIKARGDRELLIYAAHCVNEAQELVLSLDKFRDRVEMGAFLGVMREAAWEFERVLDSHVSRHFLETEDKRQPLLFRLKLWGIKQEIDAFIEKVMKMEKLLNPWLQEQVDVDGGIFGLTNLSEADVVKTLFISWLPEEQESEDEEEDEDAAAAAAAWREVLNPWLEEDGDGDGERKESKDEEDDGDGERKGSKDEEKDGDASIYMCMGFLTPCIAKILAFLSTKKEGEESNILDHASRSRFIRWFATKAASVFLGGKEEYIQDLENLLPQEHEGDNYAVLFPKDRTNDFSRMVSKKRFRKINEDLMIWWINKAAASISVMEMDPTQRRIKLLPQSESESESGVEIVGSTDLFYRIRDDLLRYSERLRLGTIVGMAGIGKTALAKKIMQEPLIQRNFECCIFVRMGPECRWEEAMRATLTQIPGGDEMLVEEDGDLDYTVRRALAETKCLIVLDDFWNRGPNNLVSIVLQQSGSQSVILFTSRIDKNALDPQVASMGTFYQVPLLNKEESWDLLRVKIFGESRCPPQLEKAGKRIAENCEGLPLLILAVAGLLSQAEKTPEYWSEIAKNKKNSIFLDAYEQVSDVVYPSYYYLPQHLKACFLYLGAFPQNDEVRISRLINLWSADGFLGVPYILTRKHAYNLLREVVSNNAALVTQWSTGGHQLKACSLHSVFWYLSKREAQKEKFLHVLNSYRDASAESIETQRRLAIYNNSILSIKDVHVSIASISAVHSLLCTGPYHQYEVPICLGLRLVKVLDALTIRFYEFPTGVLKLVQLRYLSLTSNGNLPHSISNLWGLQCLILHQHLSINFTSVSHSYLPVEIWHLQELEHLQITGRNIPNPPPGAVLRKLMILLDVGARTCTKHVLASIPNLEKLRIQIELIPVAAEPPRFCGDVSNLQNLDSLQFFVVNPELIVAPPPSFSFFSKFIRKLTLSGFGYPWKDMHKVAELPNLEDLKLKCYAFRGEKWRVREGEFEGLRYLSIEDTDLVQWTGNLRGLSVLTIKSCYRLLQLPKFSYLEKIRVVDCNPSAVTCAKQMETSDCSVDVESSWLGDRKLS